MWMAFRLQFCFFEHCGLGYEETVAVRAVFPSMLEKELFSATNADLHGFDRPFLHPMASTIHFWSIFDFTLQRA